MPDWRNYVARTSPTVVLPLDRTSGIYATTALLECVPVCDGNVTSIAGCVELVGALVSTGSEAKMDWPTAVEATSCTWSVIALDDGTKLSNVVDWLIFSRNVVAGELVCRLVD